MGLFYFKQHDTKPGPQAVTQTLVGLFCQRVERNPEDSVCVLGSVTRMMIWRFALFNYLSYVLAERKQLMAHIVRASDKQKPAPTVPAG